MVEWNAHRCGLVVWGGFAIDSLVGWGFRDLGPETAFSFLFFFSFSGSWDWGWVGASHFPALGNSAF